MMEKTKRATDKYDYTKLVERQIDSLYESFGSFYTVQQVRQAIMDAKESKRLQKSSAKSDFLAAREMFKGTAVAPESLECVGALEKALPIAGFCEEQEMGVKLVKSVYDKYSGFPKSGNYIERVVRRLGDPAFSKDSVRLAILKQFIKYTDYNTMPICKYVLSKHLGQDGAKKLSKKEKNAFVLENIDESIFEIIEADISQEERRKFTLLKLADDLSKGRFRTNGRTRSDLYVVALAFDMTCYLGLPNQTFLPERDFQKNLLHDFYNDSPFRAASDDYRENATNYEAEPTGEGINFKNFAEIVYIYYMNKEGMSAGEKLKKAEDMIKSCKLSSGEAHLSVEPSDEDELSFKEKHLKKILSLSEDELRDYIVTHFVVPVQGCMDTVHGEKKNRCTFDNYQITAKRYYCECAEYLVENIDNVGGIYGDFFFSDLVLETEFEGDFYGDRDFMDVISYMNKLLVFNKNNFYIKEDESLSRNRLLAIYAYKYYVEECGLGLSFPDLYKDFCFQVNEMLDECGFQQISEKNIFDYYLIVCLFLNR